MAAPRRRRRHHHQRIMAVPWLALALLSQQIGSCRSQEDDGPCQRCTDGLDPLNGDLDMAEMVPEATSALGISSISCSFMNTLAKDFLKTGSDECEQLVADMDLRTACGCPETTDSPPPPSTTNNTEVPTADSNSTSSSNQNTDVCQMCPGGYESIPDPDYVPKGFPGLGDFPAGITCGAMYRITPLFPADSIQCTGIEDYLGFYCGCQETLSYLNAKEHWQKVLISWLPRIAGIVSACGSFYIIYDVWRGSKEKLTIFQELLLGISFFDLCSGVAHISSSLAIPVYDQFGQPTGVYGARGNNATCKAQGFFIILGLTGETSEGDHST